MTWTNFMPNNPVSPISDYGMSWGSSATPGTTVNPWASASTPMNQYTGQPDLLASIEPTLGGAAVANADPAASSWFGDIGKTLKESGFLGSTDANGLRTDGWGGAAFSAAGGLMNGWLGMKQYGLFKEQLSQAKKQFDLNYEASKKTTNARLEDQQRARVASNPGAYSSVSDYMKKYGI